MDCLKSSKITSNDTCGIIGVISNSKVPTMIFEGLTILQNRGYDSAGIVTLDPKNNMVVTKFASRNKTDDALVLLEGELKKKHDDHKIGIGHTRWATHGPKTDENAHPHVDQSGMVAVVHNGVIENYATLKKFLEGKDISFKSETDTEVISQMIGYILSSTKCKPLEAIRSTVSQLEGTWGLCIIVKSEPDKLFACRNGSPMLIGLDDSRMFISSESSAFVKYTRKMISLKNGEIVVVSKKGVEQIFGKDDKGEENSEEHLKNRTININKETILLSPSPYPHWTIKEISEQPLSLHRSLNYGGRIVDEKRVKLGGLQDNVDWLLNINHLIIAACGTSYYSGVFGAKVMRRLRCFQTVRVVSADDMDSEDFPAEDGGLLVISQSGETRDVMKCLNLAIESDVPVFSIVNRVGSQIARTTGCGVYINAGRETAVASTKAFTSQCICLCLTALWFSQKRKKAIQGRKKLISSLHRIPTTFGMLLVKVRKKCKEIAKIILKKHSMFVLGRGQGYPIALEGALKIKEITYAHAEAYSAGSLKHGPFALIEKGIPIFMIIPNDKYFSLNMTCIEEVKSRGALVIAITDAKAKVKKIVDHVISIPSNGDLTYLLAVVPLQLIAYELSILKGINPDKPKNLAKTVTVT